MPHITSRFALVKQQQQVTRVLAKDELCTSLLRVFLIYKNRYRCILGTFTLDDAWQRKREVVFCATWASWLSVLRSSRSTSSFDQVTCSRRPDLILQGLHLEESLVRDLQKRKFMLRLHWSHLECLAAFGDRNCGNYGWHFSGGFHQSNTSLAWIEPNHKIHSGLCCSKSRCRRHIRPTNRLLRLSISTARLHFPFLEYQPQSFMHQNPALLESKRLAPASFVICSFKLRVAFPVSGCWFCVRMSAMQLSSTTHSSSFALPYHYWTYCTFSLPDAIFTSCSCHSHIATSCYRTHILPTPVCSSLSTGRKIYCRLMIWNLREPQDLFKMTAFPPSNCLF